MKSTIPDIWKKYLITIHLFILSAYFSMYSVLGTWVEITSNCEIILWYPKHLFRAKKYKMIAIAL